MSLVSIFTSKPPVRFDSLSDPDNRELGVGYHFDAIARYSLDLRAKYTSYPIEIGADVQDHGYNEPDKVVLYGYTGSRELSLSVIQLPALGASALVGNINNPELSAAAGIAGDVLANSSFLAGDAQTRGGATLEFLKDIKEQFLTFTFVSGMISIPYKKIDAINSEINETNETGLEFVVEMSQVRFSGEGAEESHVTQDLPLDDPARTQGATLLERGRVALG